MDMKQCCVKLSVQPSRGLVDEKFIILVQNAPPGFQLTVHALHQCEGGHRWEAFAHYTTNAIGTVNGPGPFPGLLDLWGDRGMLMEDRAALLASHGFASLALDYQETGKMVGNEYFEMAFRVLQQHPQVLGSRIAMLGFSFGASITLKMAAYSEVVKLRCAVCISGSHVQPVEGSIADIIAYYYKM